MFYRFILYAIFSLCTLLLALSLSWGLLYKADFLYPVWHDLGGIGAGIDRFGPKNKFKPGFGESTKAERSRVFKEINLAVHRDGKGLENIVYETPSSLGPQRFLHHDEIVHLQDVAKLIHTLKIGVILNGVVWLVLGAILTTVFRTLPKFTVQLYGLAAMLTVGAGLLFSFGAGKVFDQFHIWVFPKEHKWFFYYQDSLMSTLMMAPKLFGWIAAALVVATVVFYGLLAYVIAQGSKWRSAGKVTLNRLIRLRQRRH